jgi:hypothetical protein
MTDIDKLFGGPDAPNPEAQSPNDIEDVGADAYADGFASDPKSADFDELDPAFRGRLTTRLIPTIRSSRTPATETTA